MKFGSLPLKDALGAVLAHSTATPSGLLKKGRALSAADIAALQDTGLTHAVVAQLGPDDVAEDRAAQRIATALAGRGVAMTAPFTGRVNLTALMDGVATLDVAKLQALNLIDEGVTVATVLPFERVSAGQMIATIKIIPFGVPERHVAAAEKLAVAGLVSVAAFKARRAGLVLTRLTGTKESVLAKRQRVIGERIAALGGTIELVEICAHEPRAIAKAIKALDYKGLDPIMVFAASAIIDREDVVPAGVVAAGGQVLHVGMPVDPGNLLMLGKLHTADVIGIPSCAASPKLNGFDWVLERLAAGLPVGSVEIAAMGVGGLLKEIPTRPQPREGEKPHARIAPKIGAIVLAAGRSTRMGANNKLLEVLRGKPIVRHVVEAVTASQARPAVVVTGHMGERIAQTLAGLDASIAHNAEFASGIASSLVTGIKALPSDIDGVIVTLGDMPELRPEHLDRLIAAFAPKEGRAIVVPVRHGKRGNPVLWGAQFFKELQSISGDVGAKQLFGENADQVVEIDLDTDAVLIDVDTPEALAAVRARKS